MGIGVALLAAGCGGGGPKEYTLADTKSCLREAAGVKLSPQLDFVASTAPGGAVRAILGKNVVTISFGTTEAEAASLERGYRRVAGPRIPLQDVLQRKRNVVLVWAEKPDPQQADTIDGCLK